MLKKIVRFYLPIIIWGVLIYSISNTSVPQVSTAYVVDFTAHKFAHIVEYAILAILLYRALKEEEINKLEAVIYAIIITAFYGFTDEYHQSFTAGRTTRLRDVIFDTIGAGIGLLIIWKLLPKAPKKLSNLAKKLDLI